MMSRCYVQLLMEVGAESFDWIDTLIDYPLKIEHGIAIPRNKPGWGFSFKDEVLTQIFRLE